MVRRQPGTSPDSTCGRFVQAEHSWFRLVWAALIDISPLYKYMITGKDATRLVNRVITRDMNKVKVGQVIYCCWCDEEGKVTVCTQCAARRGITADDVLDGVRIAGAAAFVEECLADDAQALVY